MIRLLASRWKHLVRLLPLGAAIGLGFGFLLRDPLYGLMAGCALGVLFGLLFALRNPA